jgi:GTP-binding protein
MSEDARGAPVVAVVGRPNVGKSSLVNRVLGRREAIVQETPGVTRDRRSFEAEWGGRSFEIIDTGGLEPGAAGLDARVAEQAQVAMAAADLILFVVDATTGPTQDDLEVAMKLRRSDKPVLVAVNKVDRPDDLTPIADFYKLGLGDPLPVSALHGTASGDLLERLVEMLPETDGSTEDAWASAAIVGRPNVGKSSILNRLLDEDRSIVDSVPGTTRDPVDSVLTLADDRQLRLVDTAGMRREVQIKDPVEYFSFLRSRGTLRRVDAALLVVNAAEGITGHDQRIANEIVESGRACVVALNKWDLKAGMPDTDRERSERDIAEGLRFLPWATVVRTSAKTGRGVDKLLPAIESAVASHRRRLPTALVNKIVRGAQQERPHPRSAGRAVRILYAVQARSRPPTILLFTNARLEASYVRYIENRLRVEEPFAGSPLSLQVRVKDKR